MFPPRLVIIASPSFRPLIGDCFLYAKDIDQKNVMGIVSVPLSGIVSYTQSITGEQIEATGFRPLIGDCFLY